MNPVDKLIENYMKGIPRVSGDEPRNTHLKMVGVLYSPRERG